MINYTLENVNGCTKKIVFNFETLDLTSEIKNALVKKQKDVNLKGFRKGKAPLNMVEQMYGPQIENEALNQFVQNQLFDAITKEELKVVGHPKFENMKYDSGKSVSFEAVVEIFPSVDVTDLSKYSFSLAKTEVKDEDIEDLTKNYLSSKAEMVEIEDDSTLLAKGHSAVMNFQGETPDGEKPESMKGEDFLLEIGSGQFIPGFEDGMVGMKKGEKKEIEVTFPENYQATELQNAKVKFAVELLEIKEKKFPELTDELAKEFGFESVEGFKTKNKENIKKQKERESKEKLHQEILEKLIQDNQFDVPLALVAQQEKQVREDVKGSLTQQGFNEQMMTEYFEKWKEDMTSKAIFQVRSGLILDSLAKKFEVETNEADIDAKVEEMAQGSGLDIEQIKKYYTSDEKMKNNLQYAIREEKTFAKICEQANIKDV